MVTCLNHLSILSEPIKMDLYLPSPGIDPKEFSGKKMKQYFFVNGRPVDFNQGKKLISNYFKNIFHRSDILSICYIQIPKKLFEVADTSKRTIYFSNKNQIMKVLSSQLKEIYNIDEENIEFKKKSLNDSISSNSSLSKSENSLNTSIQSTKSSTPSKSNSSNFSSPKSGSTPQSKISTPNESPISKRNSSIIESVDSDFEDEINIETNLPSPSKLIEKSKELSESIEIKEIKEIEPPKKLNFQKDTNKEITENKKSEYPKEFSRHYVEKTVNKPTTVELGLSTPIRQVNNRLLSEPFTRISLSQTETSKLNNDQPRFSQESIQPRSRIEETFSKPKKDDLKKRKQEEKEDSIEIIKKDENSEEEENFTADITIDILLDQYLEYQSKESKIDYKKFYQDHPITKELIDHSEIVGNVTWKNYDDIKILKTNEEKFISLYSFESYKIEQKLIFDNLMKCYKFSSHLLDESINVSDIIPREFIIFKNIFKYNGFIIQENHQCEIELNGYVSKEILPFNLKEDLSEMVSKLTVDFEKVKNEEIRVNDLENDLTNYRTLKIVQFFERNSKKLAKKKSLRESEDQLNNLLKYDEIPKSLFKYQISLYEEE